MEPLRAVVSVMLGLVLGSFFNVIIYRVPRRQSIVHPGSHCPKCNRPIRAWENIPVLSYVFLGGKCSGCKARIPIFYPLVELATGFAGIALYLFLIAPALARFHSPVMMATSILQSLILLIVIPITVIDIFHFLIPDVLTLPALALAIVCAFLPGGITPLQCGLGIIAGGGFLYCAGFLGERVLRRGNAMGFGDVKLMALVGAAFGWKTAFLTIVLSAFTGSIVGIALLVHGKLSKDHKIPFGPFLSLGLWTTVFFGDTLISTYWAFVGRIIGH